MYLTDYRRSFRVVVLPGDGIGGGQHITFLGTN